MLKKQFAKKIASIHASLEELVQKMEEEAEAMQERFDSHSEK